MKTIVSLLRPQSAQILVELARRGCSSFAWIAPPADGILEQLTALGAGGRNLSIDPERAAQYAADSDTWIGGMQPVIDRTLAPLGASRGRASEVATAARATYRTYIENSMRIIDALDAVHRDGGVSALVLFETESQFGRVPARWARSRGVPVFMVTHGANLNRYYTCTAGVEADHIFVYGERGMDSLLDDGVPRERLSVTGNPDWDSYAERRSNKASAREHIVAAANFPPELPIVVFVTTWAAKLSAFGDQSLQERLARAVFTACARLEASGTAINLLVKARRYDKMGKDELAAVASTVGLSGFAYNAGDIALPLAAADLVIGYDTSAFVEALLLDVPCINLWDESSFLFGPPFGFTDGIPLIPMDDPDRLAGFIGEALFNQESRNRLLANGALRLNALSLPGEGAAARVATHIAAALGAS